MIVRTLTETSTKEIMQIISILKEFESSLQHRPSRNYFRSLIVESQRKVKFLEDVLEKRAEKTRIDCRLASLPCDHCWHPSTGISSCFCCKCGGHK